MRSEYDFLEILNAKRLFFLDCLNMSSRKAQESLSLTLALIVKSGKYSLGYKQAIRHIRDGEAKLVLVANNCPELRKSQLEYVCMLADTPIEFYSDSSRELGIACGRQFNVSVMSVIDAGDADLTNIISE
eukprot:gnl/Dysnectes_brevis/43_a51_11181.p2 GENE.gnl/Dysnectes_brevis/43_a51_11181~~gnl/Dysnectes_brevis/43_a51_11181.p2  ORF type:complete len:137 (+),score=30.09 gnl/Dysnectes_brevis/43_a51_11181:22-411(+)